MQKLKKISGIECIKILCNKFGFLAVRQRGSHVVLRKETPAGPIGTVVARHKELKLSMLKEILSQAKIAEEEFAEYQ